MAVKLALSFEEMLERLGRQGRLALLDTWKLYKEGYIARDTFIDVSATLLEHISDQSANYGRISYGAVMAQTTGQPLPAPSAIGGNSRKAKIAQSIETIMDGETSDQSFRLGRLGYVVPMEETQQAYQIELQRDTKVEGWQRGLNSDACELCRWWWREGRIWPKDHPMPTHKGCKCQQVPKYAERIQETGYTRTLRAQEYAREGQALQEQRRKIMQDRGLL